MARSPLAAALTRALAAARQANHAAAGVAKPRPVAGRVTRRRLLAFGAAAAAIGPSAGARPRGPVAIIGAGLAGLTAAWHLRRAGVVAQVYEAAPRLGGRILTRIDAAGPGLVTELGGEFINTEHADMLALIEAFGLGPVFDRKRDARAARPISATAYYLGGRLWLETELATKLRPLAARIAVDAALTDRNYDRYAPGFDALSVTEYLNANATLIPDPAIRALVEQTIRTEYGVEPGASSALQLLFNLPSVAGEAVELLASDERFTLPGGNARIIEALAAALSGQVATGRALRRIGTTPGGGYRLGFADGTTATAAQVIVTLPFPVLRRLDIDLPLGRPLERAIAAGALGTNEKVIAGVTERVWRHPGGFVGEVWTDLGFAEAWDATQRQPGPAGALSFYLGGDQVAAFDERAGIEGPRLLAGLEPAVPGVVAASNGAFLRTRWGRSPYSLGAYSTFPPGALTGRDAQAWVERPDGRITQGVRAGDVWFAGEHLSDAYYGYMNGAAETGRLAALSLLAA